jgi:hypothetical protein
VLSNLFIHGLLPDNLLVYDDFTRRRIPIPRLDPPKKQSDVQPTRRDNGLFTTLTQLLSLTTGSLDDDFEPEPTDDEILAESSARSCIAACRTEELFNDSRYYIYLMFVLPFFSVFNKFCLLLFRYLEESALQNLIQSIISLSHQSSMGTSRKASFAQLPVLKSSEPTQETPLIQNGEEKDLTVSSPISSDPPNAVSPAAAFHLELLVIVTLQNRDRIDIVWEFVFQQISSILKDSSSKPPALVEKAIVSLLRLMMRVAHKVTIISLVTTNK